jgi:hypothetical protein
MRPNLPCQRRAENPALVPNTLPLEQEWQQLTADLPLRLLRYADGPDFYLALLQVRQRLGAA